MCIPSKFDFYYHVKESLEALKLVKSQMDCLSDNQFKVQIKAIKQGNLYILKKASENSKMEKLLQKYNDMSKVTSY